MSESILESTKKNLGIEPGVTAFDSEVILHINSALTTLNQLGIGPVGGFMISGNNELWADFLGADPTKYNSAKTYIYLSVRLVFDPPSSGFALTSVKEQLQELAFRLNVQRESEKWVDPNIVMQLLNEVN